MSDRALRLLVFLSALLLAAMAILTGLIVTDDGTAADGSTAETVAFSVDPVATSDAPAAPTGTESPAAEPEPAPDPEPEREAEPEDEIELPYEEWSEAYELVTDQSAVIPVPSAEAPVVVSLTEDGLAINRDWWIVSNRYVGPEGCRDSPRNLVDQPISLDVLDITDGWYACIDVDNFARFGQLWLIGVEPVGFVVAEVTIWNFAPPAGS